METPILALTRARRPESGLSPATAAGRNMRLLVQLRWIAVAGQLLAIMVVEFALGVALPLAPMLAVVAVLAFANSYSRIVLYRRPIGQTAILQALLFDVAALAFQLYLSGGVDNPFISLFFLQVVLGAILLDFVSLGILAAVAIAAYAMLAAFGTPLAYPPDLLVRVPQIERLGAVISFALTGGLLAVFMARISRNLRARDAYLADLRQHAAEEDGIVRTGLLASGMAHELGTPLSTVSVILNDWSRMPRIAGDGELSPELTVMQREVERCKTIVGDILHLAGTPRGELEIVAAEALLKRVVADWQPTWPMTPVAYRSEGLNGALLFAEPAVVQVIASLLDNAAQACPGGVTLTAARTTEGLEVSITDDGPGFTEAQLALVGQPHQSIKGPGHGMGLFLAAALARRLGGRLNVANRPEGGALVQLVLPLAPDRGGSI